MLYEYAVQPGLLSNWRSFQHLIAQFGFDRGRLIVRYPSRWKLMVYDSLAKCGAVEKKRIEEALRRIDDRMVRRKHQWDAASPWLRNAEAEHSRRPFRAIVADGNPNGHPCVLVLDDLDDTLPCDELPEGDPRRLWYAPRSRVIRRNAREMAAAVEPILQHAMEILLVDKHFGPENARHRRPFEEFLEAIAARAQGTLPRRVEVHTGDKSDQAFFRSACQKVLGPLVPAGMSVRLVRWNCDHLHNRFILTDRGGVAFLEGLDEYTGHGREEDVVVLLDEAVCRQLFHDYDPAAGKFTYCDECVVEGRKAP